MKSKNFRQHSFCLILGKLNSQAFSAFFSAARQYLATAFARHAGTKTMSLGSFSGFWLIGSFGHIKYLAIFNNYNV